MLSILSDYGFDVSWKTGGTLVSIAHSIGEIGAGAEVEVNPLSEQIELNGNLRMKLKSTDEVEKIVAMDFGFVETAETPLLGHPTKRIFSNQLRSETLNSMGWTPDKPIMKGRNGGTDTGHYRIDIYE